MEHNDISRRYFEWLYDLGFHVSKRNHISYKKVAWLLFDTEFTWTIPLDENRASDGLYLRIEFANDVYGDSGMAKNIHGGCSVLELMVGLALRAERDFTGTMAGKPDIHHWISDMFSSTGLVEYDDNNFDHPRVSRIVSTVIDRTYSKNGKGGLFYIPKVDADMTELELWSQLMRYITYSTK